MKNILSLILLLLIMTFNIQANEILLKEGSTISELVIKVSPDLVKNITTKDNIATIYFNKKFNINIKEYNKKVIQDIIKNNDSLTIKANSWASVFVAKEKDQLRIVIANTPKNAIPVNINTVSAVPVVDQTYKNEESEKMLDDLKLKFKKEDYDAVLQLSDKLIEKNPLDKYGEEALFYKALTYYELGKDSDKALFSASALFDEFTRKFPKSRLLGEAMLKSAETKEKLGFKNEAVFIYQEMTKNLKDEKYLNIAYTKVGQLYNELGQPDRALKYFTDYIQKTKPENSPIYAYVGTIYAQKNDFAKAEEFFSKYKPKKLEDVPAETLYWMAETYRHKNDLDNALKIFTLFYNKYQNHNLTDMAMYQAADILYRKDKKDIALGIWKDTKNRFPNKKGGILSAIRVAEETLDSNDPTFWSVYLKDAMANDIDINLAMKASTLLIKSMIKHKEFDAALKEISVFESKYPSTKEAKDLLSIKEDIYHNLIKNSFEKKEYNKTIQYIDKIISEFPKTKYLNEVISIKEEIDFDKIKNLYNSKKYSEALKQLEFYMASNKNLIHKDKWQTLWEDTLYNYTMGMKNDPVKFGLNARQFISLFPNSQKATELKELISKNIQKEFDEIIKSKDYYSIVVFYQKNKNELDQTSKKDYYTARVAIALYMIGEKDKAKNLINNTKHIDTEVELVKFMLGLNTTKFNINNYNETDFQKIIDELINKDPSKAFQLSLNYQRNKTLGVKNALDSFEKLDENTKSNSIKTLLTSLEKLPDNIKKSAFKIYYQAAERDFLSKNYNGAITHYQNYLKFAPKNDPNMQEALYFLGKSYIALNNKDLAIKYLTELTKQYPNSQYSNLAKTEIEDLKWKSLKR
ncbi:MAG: tetratricopeptide repeat protein [Calditerrivibrio sp.]|nr:tetratricopeptide repeat protein [Calditerrivibrio sp.]